MSSAVRSDILTLVPYGPVRWFNQLQDRFTRGCLPAAALSHQSQGLTLPDTQGDAVDGMNMCGHSREKPFLDGKVLHQIRHLEQCSVHPVYRLRSFCRQPHVRFQRTAVPTLPAGIEHPRSDTCQGRNTPTAENKGSAPDPVSLSNAWAPLFHQPGGRTATTPGYRDEGDS